MADLNPFSLWRRFLATPNESRAKTLVVAFLVSAICAMLVTGTEHLGHVRGVRQHQREPAEDDRRRRDALQPQPGQSEPDEQQHEDQRQPAEHVDVAGGERAQREEGRAAEGPGEGQQHRHDDDHHRAHRHDPDVQPQPLEHLGQRRPGHLGVEERLLDPRPPRRAHQPEHGETRHHDGADQGYQRRATGLAAPVGVAVALPLLVLERLADAAAARHRPGRVAAVMSLGFVVVVQLSGGLATIDRTTDLHGWGRSGALVLIAALIQVLGALAFTEAGRALEEGTQHRYELRSRFGESVLMQIGS